MVTRIAVWLMFACAFCLSVPAQIPVFINEIHYDNTGADVGEGVEIAGPAGTNLACFRIYLYNGAVPGAAVVYDSVMLSGIIPDQCNGFGTLNFPVNLPAQIQNGSNDGMALVYNPLFPGCGLPGLPYVVQLLSYEGVFTAASGPAIGMTSTDIGVNEASTTAVGLSLQLTGAGVLYSDFTWATIGAATPGALNNGQTFGGTACGTGPVIPTRLNFALTPSGCNLPGGTFSIQVCATNNTGFTAISYNNPITISLIAGPGVLSGTTTQAAAFGCATFAGLSLSAAGTYQFRATDGILIDDTSAFVYISPTCATCPNLNAVLVDACGAQEGRNEILFFNSGDFAIPADPNMFSVNYGSGNPPATGYLNSMASNQPFVDALNLAAGCNLFHDALSNSPIPPNTNFIVMSYTPLTTYNFSAWCSLGSVYVLFSNDPDWDTTSGNWKNCLDCGLGGNGLDPRYFRTDFSGLAGGPTCDFTYNYTPCSDLLCMGNGDGIDFGYGGGTPTATWNECTPTNVLAATYGRNLQARRVEKDVYLDWQTLTESNSAQFRLERAAKPTGPFSEIGVVAAAGVSSEPLNYQWIDRDVSRQQIWYRLTEVDANGLSTVSEVVLVTGLPDLGALEIATEGRTFTFDIQGNGAVRLDLFDITGRQVRQRTGVAGRYPLDLSDLDEGVYCYRILVGIKAYSGKIAITR
ncbi:MAG: T9SS type A sorting domain-containing protein [Bacteroidia bacterium]|nr:T9SS type A sorting domain-containing protein [Bacteroidia bacterium]